MKEKQDKVQTLILDYDDEEDILYVSFNKGQAAVCIEQKNGVLTRVPPETGEIVGYTIMDFLGKFSFRYFWKKKAQN